MFITIDTDGAVKTHQHETGRPIDYPTIRDAVGGWIQPVDLDGFDEPVTMFLDEEGKLRSLPLNDKATSMTRGILQDFDLVVGNVILVGFDEDTGNSIGLRPETVEAITARFA